MRCEWEKDVYGFYILPLFGYSNVEGLKSIWFGIGPGLFTWVIQERK